MELIAKWDPKLESTIMDEWEKEGHDLFKNDDRPKYIIDTPPPYVNMPIHIGHAYTYVYMDAIARYKRMHGFDVLFPLGLDRNGLPIEVQVEKELKLSVRSTPRELFISKCKEMLDRYSSASVNSFKQLGISFNYYKKDYTLGAMYETDDQEFRRLTQETFIELYNQGLVYESEKVSNYCPDCKISLSDAEVEYEEGNTALYYIKFETDEQQDLTVATTRPELLGACKAIIYNPEDKRYENLQGKYARVPIYGHAVPILAHPYAKQEFGTGLVMICSFGDRGDIMVFKDLGLTPTFLINERGLMNDNAGKYGGLKVREARKAIVDDLKNKGLIAKEEQIKHETPICWRSKTPIEFIPRKELYLKQVSFKGELKSRSSLMQFYAPESSELLTRWIDSLTDDWVISRRRYYGTEIPIWYCKKCGTPYLPPKGKYYRPWIEKPPIDKCPKCGANEFVGEARIFDTWFDSSNTPMYISGYLWNREFFRKNFPVSLRPQGKEIVRSWLYFTLLKSYLITGDRPFKDVWIHMHVVDEKGFKMSKSQGNVIDPMDIIKRYGAEAFRSWVFLEGDITQTDVKCSYNRIESAGKFLTKLLNMSKFVKSFNAENIADLTPTDMWILSELRKLVTNVNNLNDKYAFNKSFTAIRDYTWFIFADHYLEMIKPRIYNNGEFTEAERASCFYTMNLILKTLLKLMAPYIPFITFYIYKNIYGGDVHQEPYPTPLEIVPKEDYAKLTDSLVQFNHYVWNLKKANGKSLKDPINLKMPQELAAFKKDLIAMHNISPGSSVG
ncbi:MAG: valine--tRNA ligase [Nitrososphaerota archaeon]|nr:valine--tRNA ligase [Nitrososphaerota archaeon]MDG6931315.1 valine--tRNA ligase [Nitrososphaerota archaeon]